LVGAFAPGLNFTSNNGTQVGRLTGVEGIIAVAAPPHSRHVAAARRLLAAFWILYTIIGIQIFLL
jgi:hypothetical protein